VFNQKFIAIAFFSAGLFAQPPLDEGMTLSGEIQSSGATHFVALYVELYDPRSHLIVDRAPVATDGSFRFYHATVGWHDVRVVSAPNDPPLFQESHQIGQYNSPLVLHLPEQKVERPASGKVSLHELEHPTPKRAMRAALDAERFSQAHDFAKAIEKLEEAIRIAPSFRDARANLGVQYARVGRMTEALAQFQQALEIGPPDVIVCSNLSFVYIKLGHFREAEAFARQAVALDPANSKAQMLLRFASSH
jgi:tetratricopeptide (TPR) repeat protein